jgi:hypothetical protein
MERRLGAAGCGPGAAGGRGAGGAGGVDPAGGRAPRLGQGHGVHQGTPPWCLLPPPSRSCTHPPIRPPCVRVPARTAAQVWHRSNWHWALKQERRYPAPAADAAGPTGSGGAVLARWDDQDPLLLHVVDTRVGVYERVRLQWDVCASDRGTAVVVHGSTLALTPTRCGQGQGGEVGAGLLGLGGGVGAPGDCDWGSLLPAAPLASLAAGVGWAARPRSTPQTRLGLPRRHAMVPPPMCAARVALPSAAVAVAVTAAPQSRDEAIAAVLAGGGLALAACEDEDWWHEVRGGCVGMG